MAKESHAFSDHFNLLEANWIPVLLKNGQIIHVNPIECLEQSGNIVSIVTPSPMDRMAIFRFLLALLCWCDAHERLDVANMDSFDFGDLRSTLIRQAGYFNLFGEGDRFF